MSGWRLLLVDDEPQIVRALTPALQAAGYTVETASTGEAALVALAAEPCDAIILDLGLPDLDGKEVIVRVREWSDAPIIVLSARDVEGEKIAGWKLKAFKYYYIPTGETGLAGIVIEPTDDWLRLQQKMIEAVAPFTVQSGSEAAFHLTPEDGAFSMGLVEYVAAFVPGSTGKNFNPHVTIGVAPQDYLKPMLAEPFEIFTFSPAGVSVYQLGNYGTARRKLKAWELTP